LRFPPSFVCFFSLWYIWICPFSYKSYEPFSLTLLSEMPLSSNALFSLFHLASWFLVKAFLMLNFVRWLRLTLLISFPLDGIRSIVTFRPESSIAVLAS